MAKSGYCVKSVDLTPMVFSGGNVYVTGDIYANGNSNYATVKYNQGTEINVTIDIKPGSYPNSINVKSNGVIPVAILGSVAFDVNTVDPLSVKLGPITTETGATEIHNKGHIEDVNGDSVLDLVMHFDTGETGASEGEALMYLTGRTFSEQCIQGSDSIVTVGSSKN